MNRLAIFSELDESQIELLQPLLEPFACPVGTVILEQNAPADWLYFLLSGTVEMSYRPYDGNPITVSHVETGGLFGWSAVIGSKEYTSSAIAIEAVEAFRVRGLALRALCEQNPEAGCSILERLASAVTSRWKDARIQVKSLLVQGMTEKPQII